MSEQNLREIISAIIKKKEKVMDKAQPITNINNKAAKKARKKPLLKDE